MSLLNRVAEFIASKDMNNQTRDVDASDFGLALSRSANAPTAGEMVTVESAMRAAMGACIRLLADDISTLPWHAYRKVGDRREPYAEPRWMSRPGGGRWDTPEAHVSDAVVSLLTDGNIFLEAAPHTINPLVLNVLDPSIVNIEEGTDWLPRYNIQGYSQTLADDRIVHIPWIRLPGNRRGLNAVEQAREFTGLELAARRWASNFFANGATLGGVILLPQGTKAPSREAVAELRRELDERHKGNANSWLIGVLSGGATIHDGNSIKPGEADLGPLWDHVLEEAARYFHVPVSLLSSSAGGAAYASVEHRSIEYVQHAVVPIVRRLESAYSRLIPGDDTYIRFNVDALLRGDRKTRAESNAIELQNGVITRDEWRAREDMPPAADGEGGYLRTPNNSMTDVRIEDASKLIRSGFDPNQSLAFVGLDSGIKHLGFQPTTQYLVEPPDDGDDPADGPAENTQSQRIFIDTVSLPEDTTAALTEAVTRGTAEAVAGVAGTLLEQTKQFSDALERLATPPPPELPEVTRIERDANGRAVAVYKRKGGRVVRQEIEHDADGNIVGVK